MRTGKRTTQNTTHNPSREAAQCCKLSIHRLDNRAVRVSLLVSVCVCVCFFCIGPIVSEYPSS